MSFSEYSTESLNRALELYRELDSLELNFAEADVLMLLKLEVERRMKP